MTLFSWLLNGTSTTAQKQQLQNHVNGLTFDTDRALDNIVDDGSSFDDDSSEEDDDYESSDQDRRYRVNLLQSISVSPLKIQNYATIPKDNSNIPLELVFSFDTTGRMYKFFERMKTTQFKDSLFNLFKMIPLLNISIIAHGDYCDDSADGCNSNKCAITILPFTNDFKAIIKFIDRIEKTDGGDAPEAYEYVLRKSRELPWSFNSKKAIVLFGDDVPHPPSYTDQHLYWRNELHFLTKIGVRMYGVQCLNNMHSQLFYEELASLSGGRYVHLQQPDDIDQLLTLVCLRENGSNWLNQYLEKNKSLQSNKSFTQLVSDTFVRERETLNVRFSWWDISNDADPNPKFTWNDKSKRFEVNVTNFIQPKLHTIVPNMSTSVSASSSSSLYSTTSIPTIATKTTISNRHPQSMFVFDSTPLYNASSIYTPISTPVTPYANYRPQQMGRRQPVSTPMPSRLRQVKIGVAASPKNSNTPTIATTASTSDKKKKIATGGKSAAVQLPNKKRKSFDSEEEGEDEDNSSYSTPSSDEQLARDLFVASSFPAIDQQGSLLRHQHKKELLFLEKPPKPPQSQTQAQTQQSSLMNSSPGTAAVTSTTTTTTTSLFTVNNNLNVNNHLPSPAKKKMQSAEHSPPRVGNFVALKTASGHDFVVGKVLGYSTKDTPDQTLRVVDVIRYQCVEEDDDRYYVEGKRQSYQIDTILGSITMKNDISSNQYRLVLPTSTTITTTTTSPPSIAYTASQPI